MKAPRGGLIGGGHCPVTEEGRTEATAAELELAGEELRAADHLIAASLPRVALTRAYFAVFHAIRAMLYHDDLAPRSHACVQHLFNLHYVKTGRFDAAASRLTARLQKFREAADYAAAFVVDEAGAREELAAARLSIGSACCWATCRAGADRRPYRRTTPPWRRACSGVTAPRRSQAASRRWPRDTAPDRQALAIRRRCPMLRA